VDVKGQSGRGKRGGGPIDERLARKEKNGPLAATGNASTLGARAREGTENNLPEGPKLNINPARFKGGEGKGIREKERYSEIPSRWDG